MPFVLSEKHGTTTRYVIRRKWPKDVRDKMPTKIFRHPFPVSYTRDMADRESTAIMEIDYYPRIIEARGDGVDADGWPTDPAKRAQRYVSEFGAVTDRMNARNERVRLRFARFRLGMAIPAEDEPTAPVDYEDMIAAWIKARSIKGIPPKDQAVKGRRAKMQKLFAFLKRDDRNMATVSVADLQRYKDHLPGNLVFDHFTDIAALYAVAERNNKLPGKNPCDKIHIDKPVKGTRKPFTETEACKILEAARQSPDPLIRWGHWIAAFTGTIKEEIIGATKAEFYQEGGLWVWDFSERTGLKTAYRPRAIPIHPSLIREGLIEWVMAEPTPDGLLFKVASHAASKKLMKTIRDLGIKGKLKVHYSWRHFFTDTIHRTKTLTSDQERFVCGHAAIDVHAKNYLHHNIEDFTAAIKAFPDPTDPAERIAA